MSFAESANKPAFPAFSNKLHLSAEGTRFCVSEVRDATIPSSGKPVWHLTIHYVSPDTLETVTETLSFDKSPGTKRDDNIQELRGDLSVQRRVHGVYLVAEPTKRQSPFYALRCDTAYPCQCSERGIQLFSGDDGGEPPPLTDADAPPAEEEYVPF